MGLLRGRSSNPDVRSREYVLSSTPVITKDEMVVLIDVRIRLDVRQADDGRAWYDPAEEPTMHAVFVLALRLLAEQVTADELLGSDGRIVQALEHTFGLAPTGTFLSAQVMHADARPGEPDGTSGHCTFRALED